MKYFLIIILLAGCAEFQTKLEMMKNEQMNCRPPDVSMCAGWEVEEN